LTDISYEGQILIFTYPLIGNYGVAERPSKKKVSVDQLPSEFESSQIHCFVKYYLEDFSPTSFAHYMLKEKLSLA